MLPDVARYDHMEFAIQGAQDNGEFFTPPSIVQMIVNVIEPGIDKPYSSFAQRDSAPTVRRIRRPRIRAGAHTVSDEQQAPCCPRPAVAATDEWGDCYVASQRLFDAQLSGIYQNVMN
jgi:hypothetical protein